MSNTRQRDFRLDFCRGLALIIIFIDHVPNNPLSNFTLRNFSFCDAAEIFVLISGMASYLAYGSRFDQHGFLHCAKAIGKRWIRVYFAHLILFATVAGFVLLASHYFYGADYVGSLKLDWLVREPQKAAASALTLTYLPRLLDILPLYLVLLGVAPLFILMVKRDYRVALT
ncbi:MAG: OpgC domain-containing protein, partial [Candidatus Binataceae bacterium]